MDEPTVTRYSEAHRLQEDLPRADQIVDAVGLFCPIPIVRTAERARRMGVGGILELRADDPVTLVDLPNWCRGMGHRYVGWAPEGTELRLFLQVGEGRLPLRRTAPVKGEPHGS